MSSNEAGVPSVPFPSAIPATHPHETDLGGSALVAHLRALLSECSEQLDADDLLLMPDADLLALTHQFERSAHQLDAILVRLSGELDARSDSQLEGSLAKKAGCRNVIDLLQQLSQRPAATLGRRLKVARATRAEVGISGSPLPPRFPAIAAALTAGQLPEASAFFVIQALTKLPSHVDPERVLVAERSIVAQAAGYPFDPDADADADAEATSDSVESEAGDSPLSQDADTVRLICDRWCAFLDQDGKEPSTEEALAQRYFKLGREKNGLVPAHGLLTPDTAALVGNLLSSINSPLTSTNTKTCDDLGTDDLGTGAIRTTGSTSSEVSVDIGAAAGAAAGTPQSRVRFVEAGHGTSPADEQVAEDSNATELIATEVIAPELTATELTTDDRSYGQKIHDALRIVAEIAARAAETPQLAGAPVTVLIQTTEAELAESLQRDLERAEGCSAEQQFDSGLSNSRRAANTGKPSNTGTAWLHGHDGLPSPVSMAVARHGICSGATQRVITGPAGEILGIATPTRLFTSHQRRAIMARDGGCIIPGCTVPALWCEVHHVIEWAQGGPTSTDNGVLLCWYHHRNIDSNDWHIRMVAGLPEVLAPPWIDPHQVWRRTSPPLRTNPARTSSRARRARAGFG